MADKKAVKPTVSGFTKEEELLLNDFSRNVSTKSSALFYGNAFIVSAIPICKYIFLLIMNSFFCVHGHVNRFSIFIPGSLKDLIFIHSSFIILHALQFM